MHPYPSEMIPPKTPALNGGLYTGEAFAGPWGNVPILPDAVPFNAQIHNPHAKQQFQPNILRPGNNAPLQIPQTLSNPKHDFVCTQKNLPPNQKVASFDSQFDTYHPW